MLYEVITIAIQINGRDIYGIAGPEKTVYVTLDSTGPAIGEIGLSQGGESLIDNEGRIRSVAGTFNILSQISDNIGLSDIKYSFNGGITSKSYLKYTRPEIVNESSYNFV